MTPSRLAIPAILAGALLVACAPAVAPGPAFLTAPDSALRTLPFSEAVGVGDLLFLSGQIGVVPGTLTLAPGGIEAEAVQAMENIKAVYRRYFTGEYPARSALGANGLALGAKVEVECIASR